MGTDVEVYRRELRNLLTHVLRNYRYYFDKDGYLNSEGRRVLARVAQLLTEVHPEYRGVLREVWRCPTLENFLKLCERVLGSEVVEEFRQLLYGVYRVRSHLFDQYL